MKINGYVNTQNREFFFKSEAKKPYPFNERLLGNFFEIAYYSY